MRVQRWGALIAPLLLLPGLMVSASAGGASPEERFSVGEQIRLAGAVDARDDWAGPQTARAAMPRDIRRGHDLKALTVHVTQGSAGGVYLNLRFAMPKVAAGAFREDLRFGYVAEITYRRAGRRHRLTVDSRQPYLGLRLDGRRLSCRSLTAVQGWSSEQINIAIPRACWEPPRRFTVRASHILTLEGQAPISDSAKPIAVVMALTPTARITAKEFTDPAGDASYDNFAETYEREDVAQSIDLRRGVVRYMPRAKVLRMSATVADLSTVPEDPVQEFFAYWYLNGISAGPSYGSHDMVIAVRTDSLQSQYIDRSMSRGIGDCPLPVRLDNERSTLTLDVPASCLPKGDWIGEFGLHQRVRMPGTGWEGAQDGLEMQRITVFVKR